MSPESHRLTISNGSSNTEYYGKDLVAKFDKGLQNSNSKGKQEMDKIVGQF